MIRGSVNRRHEALAPIRLRGPSGKELYIEAVVDTGFTAALTLPVRFVTELDLPRLSSGNAMLADGTVRQFDLHAAEILWNDRWRGILVSAVGSEPLVGMRLLAGSVLRIEVVPKGTVIVSPLP